MPRAPDPIDVLVGRNIRIERLKRGMTQEKLAVSLGLTFQQVQKYEKGVNRVASGRLHQIASVFKVPVASLFEGADIKEEGAASTLRMVADPQVLRMVEAMSAIKDNAMRHSLIELVQHIASHYPSGLVKRCSGA